MRVQSPAKVNLHLEVLEKRPDGYHDIQTLMHRIDLMDEIEIRAEGEGIRLIADGEGVPGDERNLIWKAARLFCRETGAPEGFEIRCRKAIPAGAGLGGGSGNAASVLMALNELLKTGAEEKFLMEMGARLGADVPFFIFRRPALARGKGEVLTPIAMPSPLWFLLLFPPFGISTAWAYETYDKMSPGKKTGTPIKDAYRSVGDLLPILKNDLELPAMCLHPEIGAMKEEMLRRGAAGALMTGSGSALFGLFAEEADARKASRSIRVPAGWKTAVVKGI
ncbi:MAG TPA: 4-(cytidine 5'-diphospho)-2-C-methyl-D-erythritol kinase [Thermodesulfobacteriota bacterium]|nr:4-(cytidine 5'-diphospho)-2-C-methyl-D-erythritol kinase [Thermodesulfobacteriota bacterium]